MTIYNVKSLVYKTLTSIPAIKQITTSYPNSFAQYPSAVYYTSHKAYFRDGNMHELQTEWTITIDLFTDEGKLTNIADELISRFSDMGFSNEVGDSNLAGMVRCVIRLTGIIDNEEQRVFQK
ncbi:hypothetical protein C5Z25_01545 [Lactobacillus sp. CBA3605]|uniref:hypothetical protein n=1 Tax=Lactobacillus sp. CBA3605 TaxID=2099788 RepID=UPI000CFCD5F0|nr:hypothetical protein [Lactobacillus sp. CBA3605]AVK60531.1 hypothetical protein C5Z25_01545 [Lactobacillus sp. CBA3605]